MGVFKLLLLFHNQARLKTMCYWILSNLEGAVFQLPINDKRINTNKHLLMINDKHALFSQIQAPCILCRGYVLGKMVGN